MMNGNRYIRRILSVLILVGTCAAGVEASPFSLNYVPTDYPENEGWLRASYDPHGLLDRYLSTAGLVIDGSASAEIADSYATLAPELALLPGESLRVAWTEHTLFTTDSQGLNHSDVVVDVISPNGRFIEIFLGQDFVGAEEQLGGPSVHYYAFDGSIPHDYFFESNDYQSYQLYVDGVFAFQGSFPGITGFGPAVGFGDAFVGESSSSIWSSFSVDVVPEPASHLTLALLVVVIRERRSSTWQFRNYCSVRRFAFWRQL